MSDQLFVDTDSEVEIPWRDLGVGSGQGESFVLHHQILLADFSELKKKNIHTAEKLAEMMNFNIDSSTKVVTSSKHDPQCRFM